MINWLLYRSHPFVLVSCFAFAVLLMLRSYELFLVAGTEAGGTSAAALVVQALWVDLLTLGSIFFFLTSLYLWVSSQFNGRIAMRLHVSLLSVLAILSLVLSRYFSVTLIPLGADLFGYSWNDIVETVSASGGWNLFVPLAGIALVTVMFVLPSLALRFPAPKWFVMGFYGFCTAALLIRPFLHPSPKDFASETGYHIVENKTASFAEQTVSFALRTLAGPEGFSPTEYPLLKEATYEDVLSPFLSTVSAPPNIVVVIVEGLGSTFVEGGTYHGFTPFIDSLSRVSLTWKNFLSTTGRTFGVLPSLTASLPFSGQGFLELGESMPEHHSLFTLLKANGYRISFSYGGAIGFDKQDAFLKRQGIGSVIDEEEFPADYPKAPANSEGFSWGYADAELFRRSLDMMGEGNRTPRFDVFLTLSTHEPFIPPNAPYYRFLAQRIINGPSFSAGLRTRLARHLDIFASLLYTDDALRTFFAKYRQRPEYANTIFIITGDHRLIPVPMESKIDRYRVPFIIATPMITRPKVFRSVSTHADVVPTLLGFLQQKYGLKFPQFAHWTGSTIDTAAEFRNLRSRPFMPYKGEVSDFIHGPWFLSGERVFTLNSLLYAEEVTQDSIRDLMIAMRDSVVTVSEYVLSKNKLIPSERNIRDHETLPDDRQLFVQIDAWRMNSDQLFILARDTAFKGCYAEGRAICRRLLALNAEYHDVRSLMASIYAWERRYEDARKEFREVILRSPRYADAYFGLARVELWNGNLEGALTNINRTIELMPNDDFAPVLKAKIQFTMGRDAEAMKEIDRVLRIPGSPAAAEAKELKEKFLNGKSR